MSRSKSRKWLPLTLGLILSLSLTMAKSEPDAGVCKQYAENHARQGANRHVLGRAAAGFGAGTMIGAFFGGAGTGAAVGTSIGAIAGGNQRSSDYRNLYTDAFVDCMTGQVTTRQ
jgi:uncharacterized protein YcfJ